MVTSTTETPLKGKLNISMKRITKVITDLLKLLLSSSLTLLRRLQLNLGLDLSAVFVEEKQMKCSFFFFMK
jgi:hypothetical protein